MKDRCNCGHHHEHSHNENCSHECHCSTCQNVGEGTASSDCFCSSKKDESGGEDEDGHSCGCEQAHGKGIAAEIITFSISLLLFVSCFVLNYNEPIRTFIFAMSAVMVGYRVFFDAFKNLFKARFLDENFLMTIAVGGAFTIGEFAEGTAVMLFYFVGSFFERIAHSRSESSIKELMKLNPDYANLLDGSKVHPSAVQIGQQISIFPGEKIPLDATVLSGWSDVDQGTLTGEAQPVAVEEGSPLYSGTMNITGVLTAKVEKRFEQSTAAQIIKLMRQSADKKSNTENFITRFARVYTPVVISAAILLAVVPCFFAGFGAFSKWLYRALVFVVVSCPCALVLSVPMGYFAGLGAASRKGILIKGSNYLEALNSVGAIAFDKTGTITTGDFEIIEVSPNAPCDETSLLKFAAGAESASPHPIAKAFPLASDVKVVDAREIPGRGVHAIVDGISIYCGNEKLMADIGIEANGKAGTKVFVAADGKLAGVIYLADRIKPTSADAINSLNLRGIKTVILTGDSIDSAQRIAEQTDVAEVYAGLTPEGKVRILQNILNQRNTFGRIAYVGDGINDAPVIKRADVGIAMGGLGSAMAVDAADIVIPSDNLKNIDTAIDIATKTHMIVTENIVCALGIKAVVLILGALGIAPLWLAIFADTGVALLAVVNSLRALRA